MPILAWASVCTVFCFALLLNALMGVRVDYLTLYPLLPLIALPAFIHFVDLPERFNWWRSASQFLGLFVFGHLTAALLHYGTTAVGMPLVDDKLIAIDRAFGFDGPAFLHWVNANPLIAEVLNIAYYSFFPQVVIGMSILAFFGKTERVFTFFSAYVIANVISNAIYVFTPAHSAYVVFNIAAADVPNINTYSAFQFLDHFNSLRDGTFGTLSVLNVSGMMTFPSMHAGLALLSAWMMRPVPWLGIVFLVLNALMAISAISHGSHFAVDVVAGLAVAALAIAITKVLESWLKGRRSSEITRAANQHVPA